MKTRLIIALCAMLLGGGMASGATFGNTSNLAADRTIEDLIRGEIFTISEDGIATSMTAYLTNTTAAKLARCIIYKASDTSVVGVTEMRIIPTGTDVAETFNFNYTVNLTSGTSYILCVWGQAGGGTFTISCTLFGATGSTRLDTEGMTSFPPDPMIPTTYVTNDNSIYCTYTPGSQLTFGRTSVGAATLNIIGNVTVGGGAITGGIFTTPASAVSVSSITPHVGLQNAAGEIDTIQCAIYKASDSTLVDTTYKIRFYGDTAVSGAIRLWREFTFASPLTLAASTDYILAAWSGYFSSSAIIRLSSSGGQGRKSDIDETPFTWPGTLSTVSDANDYVSIFVDYTVVASGVKPRRRRGGPRGWSLVQEAQGSFAGEDNAIDR